jgi:hypothetical protein
LKRLRSIETRDKMPDCAIRSLHLLAATDFESNPLPDRTSGQNQISARA